MTLFVLILNDLLMHKQWKKKNKDKQAVQELNH